MDPSDRVAVPLTKVFVMVCLAISRRDIIVAQFIIDYNTRYLESVYRKNSINAI